MGGSGPSPPACCRTKQGISWKDVIPLSLRLLLSSRVTATHPANRGQIASKHLGAPTRSRAPRGHAAGAGDHRDPKRHTRRHGAPEAGRPGAASRPFSSRGRMRRVDTPRHQFVTRLCVALPRGGWTEGETEGAAREPLSPWARLASAGLFLRTWTRLVY